MSGICGWAGTVNRPRNVQPMAQKLGRGADYVARSAVAGEAASIAILSRSPAALLWQDDELCLAIDGYPRWDDDLTPLEPSEDSGFRIAEAYRRHGPEVIDRLGGHYSLALIRKDGRAALLATDRVGSQPMNYALAGGALTFGSSAEAIRAGLRERCEIDPQAIFNYVYFEMVPGPGTAFRGIRRLLPGQYLQFCDGRIQTHTYWKPDYLHVDDRPQKQLASELLNLLEESVHSAVSGAKPGAFLSGGLDSSTVTGMLGRVTGAPARTYSIGFGAPGYDEMDYARIASRYFQTDHHEYYVTPRDVVRAAPEVAEAYDSPFGNASAVPSLYCARLAKEDGIDQLLGGDGGDELFGGNSRYAKQWLFSLYDNVPNLVRRGLIEPSVASSLAQYFIPGKLRSYVLQAAMPMPERMQTYNLLTRLGPQRIFTEDFLSSVDPAQPLTMIAESYHGAKADNLIERMLSVDLRFTLADNDLPKVCGMCDLAGVGVAFPFLDDRILGFAQRIPYDWKVRRTRLRHFFKKAIKGFLPPEIITKTKHGFGLPFGVWLKTDPDLQTLVGDTLVAFRNRKIVRPSFIDELTSSRLDEHAAYYGTLAWTLMILELWYRSREA